MGWNREKLICALSVLVLVGSAMHAGSSFVGSPGETVSLQEPAPATVGVVGGDVALEWYPGGEGELRDPFQAKSDWRPARPDPLAPPPFGDLLRRIPLPAPVATAERAWPLLETEGSE